MNLGITQLQATNNKELKMKKVMTKMKSSEFIEKFLKQEENFHGFDDIVNISSALSRELYIGEIASDMADAINMLIRFWNRLDDEEGIPVEEREPIKMYIDSPGGELVASFTIINSIELSKTPIWTINIGGAYSGGFFIFIAGHQRLAYPLSSFMYHEGSTLAYGDAHKFRNQADFYKKQMDQLKAHTLKYTKLTKEDYEKILKDDYWLTAEEAIEVGVADRLVEKGEL
jgi:ATP-dependent Clp protease protease subunit